MPYAPVIPLGGSQDEFWTGNNPHYTPYGTTWTPNTGFGSRAQMQALQGNALSHITIKKAGV